MVLFFIRILFIVQEKILHLRQQKRIFLTNYIVIKWQKLS